MVYSGKLAGLTVNMTGLRKNVSVIAWQGLLKDLRVNIIKIFSETVPTLLKNFGLPLERCTQLSSFRYSKIVTYVDDSVIFTSSKDLDAIQHNLSEDINSLAFWFLKKRKNWSNAIWNSISLGSFGKKEKLRICGFFALLPFLTYLCNNRIKPPIHCVQ